MGTGGADGDVAAGRMRDDHAVVVVGIADSPLYAGFVRSSVKSTFLGAVGPWSVALHPSRHETLFCPSGSPLKKLVISAASVVRPRERALRSGEAPGNLDNITRRMM
jgi:hypothetical protein